MKRILAISILIISVMPLSHAQDLFNFENSLRYARHLYANGDYSEAIPELNRCIYLSPEKSKIEVLDLLLTSFRQTGQYASVLKASSQMYPEGDFPDPVLTELHYSFILTQEYETGHQLLHRSKFNNRLDQIRFEVAYDAFGNQYQNGLDKVLQFSPESKEEKEWNSQATILLQNASALKYKSPAKAGLMSVFIPGAGKFYANRKKDAIFSFILTVVAGYQSYRAFNKNGIDSVFGWVYGGLAAGFYVGNIYGSVQAAKKTNEFANERYHDQMRSVIGL